MIIASSSVSTLAKYCNLDTSLQNKLKSDLSKLNQNPLFSNAQITQYKEYGAQEGLIAYNYLKSQGKLSQTCAKLATSFVR